MLVTLLDVGLAFLITRFFRKWWLWLPLSLCSGGLLAFIFTLGMAVVDTVPAGVAVVRGLHALVTHAVFTALCAWAFSSWAPSQPGSADDPQA